MDENSLTTGNAHKGISRRTFVAGIAGTGVAFTAVAGGVAYQQLSHTTTAPQQQSTQHQAAIPTTLSKEMQIGHLLRRAGFSMNADDYKTYSTLSYNDALNHLLNHQHVKTDTLDNQLRALNLNLTKPQEQQRWWLVRMLNSPQPLLEKMTLFWHGYLTSSYRKVGGPNNHQRMMVQNEFLRTHAFDTLDNILLGITKDPAMLVYLDLTKSTRKSPNENYARELMELFTLGLGHYSQEDVDNAALALTGWHTKGGETTSYLSKKDQNTKEITFLGQKGAFKYDDIIRIVANHPATPWYLCRRLFSFFAYENPQDADIQPLVDAYIKSNHNMGEVVKALFLSPQFLSQKAYRARIKSPVEFVVGSYRALGIANEAKDLAYQTTFLGQALLDPPNVSGWPGDKVSGAWLNSGTWLSRLNYLNLLISGGKSRTSTYKPLPLQAIIKAHKLTSPEHFVDHFALFLLDGQLSAERKTLLLDYLKVKDNTTNSEMLAFADGTSYPASKVRGALYLLMAAPEYQLN